MRTGVSLRQREHSSASVPNGPGLGDEMENKAAFPMGSGSRARR